MAFLIRYEHASLGTQTVKLSPRPTEVEYPEHRLFKSTPTQDGATVLQRPLRDSRTRKWIWKGYRNYITAYKNLWTLLVSLETRARRQAGFTDTTVLIWEDETGVGGFDRTTNGAAPDTVNYSNLTFTRVRIIQANRTPRDGGGPITYDTSMVEFVLDDTTYNSY